MKKNSMLSVLAVVALIAVPAVADTSFFVTTMTNHNEEALTWCGAAAGQSIASGYPSGACNLLQSDVWDAIQANKVEASWDTDPAGLARGLMAACPLAAGHSWVVFQNASASSLMYSVAYYMTGNHFPAAILLTTNPHNAVASHREHWVTVKGIVTNADPHTTSSVTLQYVLIVDQPATLGDPPLERFLTGSQWYAQFQAVAIAASAYNGKYVAVIEPPTKSGTAGARALTTTGTIIPIDRVTGLARRALQNEALRQVPSLRALATLAPQRPVLVNAERGGAYYIVPLGKEGEDGGAVLINAYTGDLMEAARLKPRPILSESEALDRVRGYLARKDIKAGKASLVSLAAEGSPYFPEWHVNVDGSDVRIDPTGKVRVPSKDELITQPPIR